MRYAQVAVDAPIGYSRTLTYAVPSHLSVDMGHMVWVPLGRRITQGLVFDLLVQSPVEYTRDISGVVGPNRLLAPYQLELARWISAYYFSSLFESAALFFPPGFRRRIQAFLKASAHSASLPSTLPSRYVRVLEYVVQAGRVKEVDILKRLGRDGKSSVSELIHRGLLSRSWEWAKPNVTFKYDLRLRPGTSIQGMSGETAKALIHSPQQTEILRIVRAAAHGASEKKIKKEFSSYAVTALLKKGLLGREWVRQERKAFFYGSIGVNEEPFILTSAQAEALNAITGAMLRSEPSKRIFLLNGVTGSGKTEVYLRAFAECLKFGKQGLLLVPEISLTPQAMDQLNRRFPGKVALLHSGLRPGQLFDQWWRFQQGDYDLLVGPRSALFAPFANLGLVVVDEEHEGTYKQQDTSPRYHAREIAIKLGAVSNAVVVLGSATPDVVSYQRCQQGLYQQLKLPYRVSFDQPDKARGTLAEVDLVDMRNELKQGNRSIFSRRLIDALRDCMDCNNQAILFVNRRGSATVVQCRDCGQVIRCSRCEVALTYHATIGSLICHQCNRRRNVPDNCTRCASIRIKYLGLGTERVVEELQKVLPGEEILRWDGDIVRAGQSHERLMDRVKSGQAKLIVGTQMIARGLDIPAVTLVGVVLADVGLHFPDFVASERAFQLLCQVAGRAGRGTQKGRVILQTYTPDHYAIQAAAHQDYEEFSIQELRFRLQLGNPPFNRLLNLVYVHYDASRCRKETERLGRELRHRCDVEGRSDIDILGPAPSFREKVRGLYRWHLILRGADPSRLLRELNLPQGWIVDVDPVSLL